MNKIVQEIEIGNRKLSLETGFLAQQANGAVLGRYGDTVVLATVCSAPAKESLGYFPLSVEYEERLYAGGKIKTSRFIKREGRPSDNAILNARLIDRSIRPLFPKDYLKEVQVIVTILSVIRKMIRTWWQQLQPRPLCLFPIFLGQDPSVR